MISEKNSEIKFFVYIIIFLCLSLLSNLKHDSLLR